MGPTGRRAQMKAPSGLNRRRRGRQRRRRMIPRRRQEGSARSGQRRRGYRKEAVRESYQGAQRPEGVTPGMSPQRPRTRQEREAAMGLNKYKGVGLPACGKTCPVSPMELVAVREGREASIVAETPGVDLQVVGGGGSSLQGASTPLQWKSFPRGENPPEGPPRETECQGRTDGGGEGTDTPPPPKKPRQAGTEAATRR